MKLTTRQKLPTIKKVKVSKSSRPFVVDIENWQVNKLTKRVRQETNKIRNILILVEFKDGKGAAWSTMTGNDRLWWLEQHKLQILRPEH